jgi:hypothetical protein
MIKIETVVRLLSVAFLAFLYGFFANKFQLFPAQQLNAAVGQLFAKEWAENLAATHFLHPASYDRQGAQILDQSAVQPGLTLVTSYFADMDWKSGIKLIDINGKTVHEWKTDIAKLWPDAPDIVKLTGGYVHGSYLFPNGDVMFNIEHTGMFMIDSCGAVKWHLDLHTNHSVTRADDGNFWVPRSVNLSPDNPEDIKYLRQFPGLATTDQDPLYSDHLIKVTPQGEVLADIDLLKVLYENNLQRYIVKISKRRTGDVLHLNDVEELSASMAAQYPLFAAGDLVVSLRHLHMVLVLDPQSGRVKWYATDPFIEQHDPDFTGDGWITVFDNNHDFSNLTGPGRGAMLGGSRIVAVQPHTGQINVIYPRNKGDFFYTDGGGKLQTLANGNLLITEVKAGRVFEITSDGKVVWEWIQAPNEKNQVAELMEGTRYDISKEQVASWACHAPQ